MNLILLGAAIVSISADTLDLDQSIKIAEENSFSLKIAETRVEKTRQQIQEARGNLLPRLTGEATYTKLDKGSTADFGGGQSIVIQPDEQKAGKVTLSFPIDVSGNIGRGVKAATMVLSASKETLQAQKNDLRMNVRQAYYRVLQAQALVDVAKGHLASANEGLSNARKMFDAGSVAKVEVLRFETLVASAEAGLLSSENGLRLAKQAFNNVLSRPIETEFNLVEVLTVEGSERPVRQANTAALVEQALQNRPELRAALSQAEALAFVRQAEESGMNPSLGVAGIYNHNFDPGFGGRKDSSMAVATLTVPIWDNGITRSRVKAARQDEVQAKTQIEQLKLGLSLEVSQAVTNLANAKAALAVATKQAGFAAENFRLAKLRYEAGEAIQLEVIDAQAQDTQAKADKAAAAYNVLSAQAALQRAVGSDEPKTE